MFMLINPTDQIICHTNVERTVPLTSQYIDIVTLFNFWIPACAGMTIYDCNLIRTADKNHRPRNYTLSNLCAAFATS